MKKYDLLIVGNGFDLACKYYTSYSSFYDFLNIISNSKDDKILNDFYWIFENLKNDEKRNEKLINFKFEKWKHYKNNIFVQYFVKYTNIFDNWVSFEKELLVIIKAFDNLFDKLKKYESKDILYDFICEFNESSDEYRVFSFIKNCKYYAIDERLSHKDFLFSINDLHRLDPVKWNIQVDIYIDKFIEYIYDELNKFSYIFMFYLEIVTNDIQNEIEFEFISDKIINYNYTNICYNILSKKGDINICNINGKLLSPISEKNPNIVFGFNVDVKFKNKKLDLLSKSSQRVAKNTDYNRLYSFLPNKKNNHEKSICIFGHSLDEADKDSLSIIFESFNEPRIDIYYLDESAKLSLITNLKLILGISKFNKFNANGKINFIKS